MVTVKYRKTNSREDYRQRTFASWGFRAQVFALVKSFFYGDILIEECIDE